MSEDNTNSLGNKRTALGDLTNHPLKKEFSLILGDSKSVDGFNKKENKQESDYQFAKQVCQKAENMVREKSMTEFGVEIDENSLSILKNKQVCHLLNESVQHSVVEVGDDASWSSALKITSSGLSKTGGLSAGRHCTDHEGSDASDFTQSNPGHKGLVTLVCKNSEEGLTDGKLASTNYSSVGWSSLLNSQFHQLARCTARRECAGNMNVASDLLKSCSCSFCFKAAYIWSDLHYQDIKGQIIALNKSQKEANTLVQKCSNEKGIGIHIQGNTSRSSKLEMDLMDQWRSLFLHMEDIFQQESSQLQARFVKLKDLRETCKLDLEMINGTSCGKH